MSRTSLVLVALLAVAVSPAARSAVILYTTSLSGPAESPPNNSPGTGTASAAFDSSADTLTINAEWSGLEGNTTVAHIHCCTTEAFGTTAVGVAVTPTTLPGFPAGATAGTYGPAVINLLDTASYASGFLTASGGTATGARDALLTGLNNNRAYFNIHSVVYGGGEIRGFLTPVPLPAGAWLVATAFGVAVCRARRR